LAAVDFAGVACPACCGDVPGAVVADAELCEWPGEAGTTVTHNTKARVVAAGGRLCRSRRVVQEDALDPTHAAVAAGVPPVDLHDFEAGCFQYACQAGVVDHDFLSVGIRKPPTVRGLVG